ncbi:NAD(P)/FAD-dependent oxidoreductase [Williamsia serinedens]|uniref:Glycine/D-amino acid oxidase (Deaminating) n=1 Tax=Williamsia serinedens TaxID=391736 RepID=A0ABT1H0R0_9NOCA|nr:FAD-binding oxidoreductase [Williamsia serinedens]MCP2160362.1 Glycine/D-amino acid oxidase (deaminating) [Williamsia serinedens]
MTVRSPAVDAPVWIERPTERGQAMVAGARREPYWLDRPERPSARPSLAGDLDCDLLVVGGGFTGLWTAVQAAEEDPSRRVVLLEGGQIADGASGRNGGFCAASITHGLANGVARFADEMPTLVRLGVETLDAIEAALDRLAIDAAFERVGELDVATFDWQVADLEDQARTARELGIDVTVRRAGDTAADIRSPMVVASSHDPTVALVDPAKLAWGLADAAERLGVTVHEHTPVSRVRRDRRRGVRAVCDGGVVTADRVVLATAAARPLLRRNRLSVVPVFDYALMTEPLTPEQLTAIGWSGREGLADVGNRFHYIRRTVDDRVLFGGWDAVYHFGSDDDPRHHVADDEFALLADHLVEMFPALDGVGISHAWGGAIDTCSRFCAFWDRALGGRVVSVLGFTGLGVGASHFGARVALDLVDGRDTERTRLSMVRTRPLPFPPEPLRWIGITLTRRAFARADRDRGRRGVWLRAMDAVGLGFDS